MIAYPRNCERARMWASLQLDGELSDLERALLDAHVARCQPCTVYLREVGAATGSLRAAELERPAHPITVPGRRRVLRPVHVAAAAALMAVAVGFGAAVSSLNSTGGPAVRGGPVGEVNPVGSDENALIREVRLAAIEGERARNRAPQRGLGIPV